MFGVDKFIEVCVIAEGDVKEEDIKEEIEEEIDELEFKETNDLKTVDSIKEWLLKTDFNKKDAKTNSIKTMSGNPNFQLTQPHLESRESFVLCTYCKNTILSSTYQLHVWEHHGKLIHSKFTNQEAGQKCINKNNRCTKCDKLFSSKDSLVCHMKDIHSGEIALENICTKCNKLFSSKRSLACHVNEKHSGVITRVPCPECGQVFSRKPNMKAHRESMHLGKVFPCNICNIQFPNISSLRRHRIKNH